MSEPFTDKCVYCGSPDVLDDAWWCSRRECWDAHYRDEQAYQEREARTPLTREKADADLWSEDATIWGPASRIIEQAATGIARLAKLPVR